MGFNKLFLGLLFMFDFRIQGIDLLPDIIGYLFILSGLNILEDKSLYFESAKKFTYPLLVISIFDIYQSPHPAGGINLGNFNFLTFIIGIISTIFYIILVYNICKGTSEVASEQENYELSEIAMKRWNYFLLVQILYLLLFIFVIVIPPLAAILFIPLFIGTLIVLVLLMNLMKKAEEYLGY